MLVKMYDIDVSNDYGIVLSLLTFGDKTGDPGMVSGMTGDGHHNEIFKHSISESNGSLTLTG